ncbi:unnamed protein product [Phytophthora fragariaefolia]|uniref:Unnamed protein product n=1 Tax=Phytophthora fragariaefolia TaxID=1490495 RepID=A0A9W6WTX1_9STRA|nr:unnamed protein product [Phytophthora fragariaefolia]
MKFGKVLQQSTQMSPSAWEPFWADYKLLKKIIKDCAQIKKEEKLQGDRLVKIKIKPSAKEDNDSIRAWPCAGGASVGRFARADVVDAFAARAGQSQDEMNFFRTLRVEIKKIADFFIKEQAKHTSQVAAIDASFQQLKSNPDSAEAKTALMKSCVALYKELLLLENFAVMNFCGISKVGTITNRLTESGGLSPDSIPRCSSIEQHDAQKSSSRRSGGGGSSSSSPSGDAPSSSGPTSGAGGNDGADASTGDNNSSSHSPSHTPPGAAGGRHDGRRYRRAVDEASPRSEDSVTLVRVNALRDDVRELRKIESAYDGDGEYEENVDDTAFPDDDAEVPPLRFGGRPQEEKAILPALPLRVTPAGTQSDSDAAAIAMLSMKDSGLHAAGISDGGDSGTESCRTRSAKRKACAPLDMEGKRKMSVTAILN